MGYLAIHSGNQWSRRLALYGFTFLYVLIGMGRLRDAGKNPWLMLIPIVNLILCALPSKQNTETV